MSATYQSGCNLANSAQFMTTSSENSRTVAGIHVLRNAGVRAPRGWTVAFPESPRAHLIGEEQERTRAPGRAGFDQNQNVGGDEPLDGRSLPRFRSPGRPPESSAIAGAPKDSGAQVGVVSGALPHLRASLEMPSVTRRTTSSGGPNPVRLHRWGYWLARKDSNLRSPDPESDDVNQVLPADLRTQPGVLAPSESGSVRQTLPEESCALSKTSVNQAKSPRMNIVPAPACDSAGWFDPSLPAGGRARACDPGASVFPADPRAARISANRHHSGIDRPQLGTPARHR